MPQSRGQQQAGCERQRGGWGGSWYPPWQQTLCSQVAFSIPTSFHWAQGWFLPRTLETGMAPAEFHLKSAPCPEPFRALLPSSSGG